MTFASSQNQALITKHVIRILDEWGLSAKDVISILALPIKTRTRHLERYRSGEPLPNTKEVAECVEHIAGIADALRTTYPRNAQMGIIWMRTPHKRFQNQSPIQILSKRGLRGLRIVRAELDCTFAWDESSTN